MLSASALPKILSLEKTAQHTRFFDFRKGLFGMIFAGMLAMGFLLGFCGAGGSGMTIALLVAGYGVPMHKAFAVAITAMIFTMISGTVSHLREGEVEVKMGLIIGGAGMVGAFVGAHVAHSLPTNELGFFTAMMMFLSAIIMYIRLYHKAWLDRHIHIRKMQPEGRELLVLGSATGVVMGFLSGAFGIGATAFIQLALMMFFGVSLLKTVGTCMLVILPISIAGSAGYILNGHLDMGIFVQTFLGLVIGSFIGAKFTSLAPRPVLQAVVTATPLIGGLVIFLNR